jgi:hypothetical protein
MNSYWGTTNNCSSQPLSLVILFFTLRHQNLQLRIFTEASQKAIPRITISLILQEAIRGTTICLILGDLEVINSQNLSLVHPLIFLPSTEYLAKFVDSLATKP